MFLWASGCLASPIVFNLLLFPVVHRVMHKASWRTSSSRETVVIYQLAVQARGHARRDARVEKRRGARVSERKNSDLSSTSLYMHFPASKNRGDELGVIEI